MDKLKYLEAIETERLHLTPVSAQDSVFMVEILNSEGWIKYIGDRNVATVFQAVQYIRKIEENPHVIYWTVRLQGTETKIGLVALLKRDYLDFCDIGFAFLPAYSGKGFAFEAASAVLEMIEEEKVLAITLPDNLPSAKLINKLGFQFDRQIEHDNEILNLYFKQV